LILVESGNGSFERPIVGQHDMNRPNNKKLHEFAPSMEGSVVSPKRSQLCVPELGISGMPLTVSLWLVAEGAVVIEGDRVVELLAGGVTIDLEAPISGRLVQLVDEDETVTAGAVIAEGVPEKPES